MILDLRIKVKPKYSLFNNAKYALDGLLAMIKNEVSFRIELCIILPCIVISLFLEVDLTLHVILVLVLFLILILECVNSAIESCIDLITEDFHPLAKIAKDCASAAVLFSVILALSTWGVTIYSLVF